MIKKCYDKMKNKYEIEVNIFESLKNTYWKYDNSRMYEEKVWDSYSGAYFSKEDSLCLLNHNTNIIVLHFIQLSSHEIWRGLVKTSSDLILVIRNIEKYRIEYCNENQIDPERDIEFDLVRIQNKEETIYAKLKNIPSL